MLTAGLVLATLAALLHVYIFWMESLAWDGPQARKTFGVPDAEREATRAFAFNQGFYNLFLAIAALLGVIVTAVGTPAAGRLFGHVVGSETPFIGLFSEIENG